MLAKNDTIMPKPGFHLGIAPWGGGGGGGGDSKLINHVAMLATLKVVDHW